MQAPEQQPILPKEQDVHGYASTKYCLSGFGGCIRNRPWHLNPLGPSVLLSSSHAQILRSGFEAFIHICICAPLFCNHTAFSEHKTRSYQKRAKCLLLLPRPRPAWGLAVDMQRRRVQQAKARVRDPLPAKRAACSFCERAARN